MRFKLTLLLIIANLITFGFIWKNAGGDAETRIFAQSLFASNISEVAVKATDSSASFTLTHQDRAWFLTHPSTWRAQDSVVSSLLNELRFLDNSLGFSVEEVAEAGNTLSSYGLVNPAATVTVKDITGTHELKIGKTTPDGRSVYVLSPNGEFIIPAPKSLLDAISQPLENIRTNKVFATKNYEVQTITVRTAFLGGNEQRVGLVRTREKQNDQEKNAWRFETPIAADADAQLVEQRLEELSNLTYTRFVSGDAVPSEASGLKTPILRFSLEAADNSETLLVGNPDPSSPPENKTRFAKLEGNPAIFTVPEKTVNAWKNAARDLRNPYFLRFDPATLSGITIHDGHNALVLHRLNLSVGKDAEGSPKDNAKSDKEESASLGAIVSPRIDILSVQSSADSDPIYNAWQMPVAPGSAVKRARNVEPKVIAELIDHLCNLRATRAPGADNEKFSAAQRRLCEAFVADVATPEDVAQMKFNTPLRLVELEFTDSDGKTRTQTLTIAPPAEEGTPIHAKTGTAIYSITPEILSELSVQPSYFRDRTVYALPEGGKISSIVLSEIEGTRETVILDEKRPANTESWTKLLEGNEHPFEQTLAKLLRAVANVSAESYLPEPFSRDFTDKDYLDMDVPESWRYKLEVTIALAAGEKNTSAKTEKRTYYLTRRLGGTTQLAGSPEQDCIFRIRQDFIDALHTLTFNRSGAIPNIDIPLTPAADNFVSPQ